jgi:HAD superfamily hydrolase (TIGR01484 family)
MPKRRKISLVLADVDGTLLTEQKILTQRAQTAVATLREAHVRFAITSGRPPRGMAMLFDALQLDTPIAGFNGGLFVKPDLSIIEQKTLPQDIAVQAITLLRQHELDVWIYTSNDWLITKPGAPHVAREAWTVKFEATVVPNFDNRLNAVAKIVGVSDDLERVRQCEVDVQAALGTLATANRSQPYYLDVTHKQGRGGRLPINPSRYSAGGDCHDWRFPQ